MIRLGTAASCICANKDSTNAIVAGRNALKVLHVTETGFEELDNLRSRSHQSLNYSTNDIDWSLVCQNRVATAATNGAIVLWDISKSSKIRTEFTLNHHARTVNRIMFHPSEMTLLSGAQDGRIKSYDLRIQKVAMEMPGSCSVRDMQFNRNPMYFTTACDNGTVVQWDLRNIHRPERTVPCHNGAVLSIDWHPETSDGKQLLVTGGLRDSMVKVWKFQGSSWTCKAQAKMTDAVRKVKWRPDSRRLQILTCHMMYPDLYMWDMSRPFVPLLSFEGHMEPVTGVLWRDPQLFPRCFFSAGKDGILFLRSIEEGRLPARETNPMGLAMSCRDDVMVAYAGGLLDTNRLDLVGKEAADLHHVADRTHGTAAEPPSTLFSNGRPYVQSIAVEVGFKAGAAGLGQLVGAKRGFRDNRLPFSARSSLLKEFMSEVKAIDEKKSATNTFIELARNYRLHGASLEDLCEHNAGVAATCQAHYVQATWLLLSTMFCESAVSSEPSLVPPAPASVASNSHVVTPSEAGVAAAAASGEASGPSAALTAPVAGSTMSLPAAAAAAPIVSDGGDGEEKEGEERGVHSRSGQETTTANSEDDLDPLGEAPFEKFDTTFANVEPIDFLFSDGREELDLFDVFSSAQNNMWAADLTQLPHEAIHPHHDIDPAGLPEMGDEWTPNEIQMDFSLEDAGQDDYLGSSFSRSFFTSGGSGQAAGQRRLRTSSGKQNTGSKHGRRSAEESNASTSHPHYASSLLDCSARLPAYINATSFLPPIDYGPLAVEHLTEKVERMGDVQTACCTLIVLGDRLRENLCFEKYEVWLHEYLDALSRYELWCESTLVTNLCGHPQVAMRNQEGTTVNNRCGRCGKAVSAGGVCQKHQEKPPLVCVVCHETVRGLYLWCQGCGHGGHYQHVEEWLVTNRHCPGGCGHQCEYF